MVHGLFDDVSSIADVIRGNSYEHKIMQREFERAGMKFVVNRFDLLF
jgi:hypothetical protein